MSLNIKNPEAHRLATELAKATGKSLTQAVTDALRESLMKVRSTVPDPQLLEDLRRISKDCASRMSPEAKAIDHGEYLYDELGMPK